MWGLLAPTPPGRARKPCTGVGRWYARLLSAILNVPKLRKICRLLWRQIFHSFVTGSARGGPLVPRTPLRWAAALPVAIWSGGRAVGVSGYANGFIYVQATQHSPYTSAHTEQRRQAFISRASGAPHQLPWSPSGDTHSSPACSHRTTPQGVHKPRKRRNSPLPWSPTGGTAYSEPTPQGVA